MIPSHRQKDRTSLPGSDQTSGSPLKRAGFGAISARDDAAMLGRRTKGAPTEAPTLRGRTKEAPGGRRGIEATTAELVALFGALQPLSRGPLTRIRTLQSGPWRSAFRGRGIEFDETRMYQAGDDVRSIDWRVTARTGRVHTKLFHEERERPVLLLLDQRPSMRFGTRGAFKSVAAARAAAAVAWAAREGGDRVGAAIFGAFGREELRPHRSQHALLALLSRMAHATASELGAVPAAGPALREELERMTRVARPGTLLFVFSDFHDLDRATEHALDRLGRITDLCCILVHDPIELALPRAGDLLVTDGRNVRMLPTSDAAWRKRHLDAFQTRRERLARLCARTRGLMLGLRTDEDVALALRADRFARARRHPDSPLNKRSAG